MSESLDFAMEIEIFGQKIDDELFGVFFKNKKRERRSLTIKDFTDKIDLFVQYYSFKHGLKEINNKNAPIEEKKNLLQKFYYSVYQKLENHLIDLLYEVRLSQSYEAFFHYLKYPEIIFLVLKSDRLPQECYKRTSRKETGGLNEKLKEEILRVKDLKVDFM